MTSIVDPTLHIVGLITQNTYLWISNFFSADKKELIALNVAIPGAFSALILFVIIFAGGFFDKRFWCQYICPTGAFLGLLGRFSFFRRHVNAQNCNNCKVCATRQCPTRAINQEDTQQTNTSECILCGTCAENRRGCTTISFVKPSSNENVPLNFTRRSVLGGLAAGILLPSVIKGSVISEKRVEPIRPPGSIPEEQFLTRCLGCGECIKACPNHALQPSGFAGGFMLLNTPRLTPSIGYCQPGCTVCTNVCPSVAIRPVPVGDKPYIKMGTAIVLKDHCYAWRGDMPCMVCMQKCSYQAITVQTFEIGNETISGPLVNKDLCTGCGACEKFCANKTYQAIRVFNYGERRIESGPFISDKKKKRIDSARNEILNSSE
jgi:ferredoxin